MNGTTGPTGATGPIGFAGATGATGATGANGLTPYIGGNGDWFIGVQDTLVRAQGPTGPTGPTATVTNMGANNTNGDTFAVVPAGTAISLPNNQILNGFNPDGSNTSFSVTEAGTYLISYRVGTTLAVGMSVGVTVNGVLAPSSTLIPPSTNTFHNTFLLNLAAGDRIGLQLSNYTGAATLQNGTGAQLTAVRIR